MFLHFLHIYIHLFNTLIVICLFDIEQLLQVLRKAKGTLGKEGGEPAQIF